MALASGVQVVASAARTASGASGAITLAGLYAQEVTAAGATATISDLRGVTLFVNVTAVSGTGPTLLIGIQGQDVVSLVFATVHAALANITATGLYVITMEPGAAQSVAGYPAIIAGSLPSPWQVAWTIGGTTPSFTFSVSAVALS